MNKPVIEALFSLCVVVLYPKRMREVLLPVDGILEAVKQPMPSDLVVEVFVAMPQIAHLPILNTAG